jgi:hypothetical protein
MPHKEWNERKLVRVYKLYLPGDDNIYIGSTCQPMRQRLSNHASFYKKYATCGKIKILYKHVRENGRWEQVECKVLEEVICASLDDQLKAEQTWIKELKPSLNDRDAHLTREECNRKMKVYYAENKERINQRNREYAQKNKEHLKQKSKEYAQKNKEHIDEYHKKWVSENSGHLKAYKKKYYQKTKAKQLAKEKLKYKSDPAVKAKIKARAKACYEKQKLIKVRCACGKTKNTKGRDITRASIKAYQRKNCKCATFTIIQSPSEN